MDPIGSIDIRKDSTFAMLLEAQKRDWNIWYTEQGALFLRDGMVWGHIHRLSVADNPDSWFKLHEEVIRPLNTQNLILMRKDPPFDMEYIYTTYLLEKVQEQGVLVVNRPATLRDCNEKLFATWFPQCSPPTLVSRLQKLFLAFLDEHKDIILKPLNGMGGDSIFRIRTGDPNLNVIIETLTQKGSQQAMAQRFIPEIAAGDKRILMIDGEPVPYSLARIPKSGETRGNLATGGIGKGAPLSERDYWIATEVGPTLRERGILFAGLDVIGDYLTEINITSPTCIRELDSAFRLNISADLFDKIEEILQL